MKIANYEIEVNLGGTLNYSGSLDRLAIKGLESNVFLSMGVKSSLTINATFWRKI